MVFGLLLWFHSGHGALEMLLVGAVALGLGLASYFREERNVFAAVGRVLGLLGLLAGAATFLSLPLR